MKSVVSNEKCEEKEIPYPKLMVSPVSNGIYLMNTRNKGTCVSIGVGGKIGSAGLGEYVYTLSGMKDFKGSVCLQNDES